MSKATKSFEGSKGSFRKALKTSFLAGSLFLCACSQTRQPDTAKTVAIEPITCDLVSAISLSSEPIQCLIPQNQDPHNFRFSPKDAEIINRSNLIITLGKEMTPSIKKWLSNPSTVLVGVRALEKYKHHEDEHIDHSDNHMDHEDEHIDHSDNHMDHEDEHIGHEEHHHLHDGLDPHVWHDPQNLIEMSEIIFKALKSDYPVAESIDNDQLHKKHKNVVQILTDLDNWNKKQIATIPSRNRVVASKHKAMEYYANKYGINTLSLLNYLGHSSSLQPKKLSSVISTLKRQNVPILFAEQIPPSKIIKNLSSQSSIAISSNPLYVDGLKPGGSIVSTAVSNTCTIVDNLGGSCDNQTGQSLIQRWQSLLK